MSVLFLFGQPGTALAHERRKVGKYELEAGFLNEPALQWRDIAK